MIASHDYDQDLYDELDALTNGWLEGLLNDSESERLQALLRGSSELRSLYLTLIHTDTLAQQALKSQPIIAEPLIPVETILTEQKRRAVRTSVLAAAAVIAIGVMVMSFFLAPKPEAGELTFQTSQGTHFTLSHDSSHDELPTGQAMVEGSRLQISQGTVELTFPSGVKSLVMAPADITLRKNGHLTLDLGTAWFHVPEKAIGFTVQTKHLKVVDLGTKFGISTDPEHVLTEVHVFKGKVRATARHGRKEEVVITANHALELDPTGRLKPITCQPSTFLTTLPDTLPHLHWSFDDTLDVTGTHPDASGIPTTATSSDTARSSGAEFAAGKRGQALSLDGRGSYVITDWPGFDGDRPRTVSFWLKLPENWQAKRTQGLVGWGSSNIKNAKWALVVRSPRKAKYAKQTSKHADLFLALGRKMSPVSLKISLGQWHHIAASYSGTPDGLGRYLSEIYIDGELATLRSSKSSWAAPLSTSIHGQASQPLSIGVNIRSDRASASRHYLHGMIDDLTIFEGYMTAEEIKRLAE